MAGNAVSTSIDDLDLRHWVDGQRLTTNASAVSVVNPATEEVVARVPSATENEAILAIEAAARAFHEGPWPRLTPQERSAHLARFAHELQLRRGLFEDIAVNQMGATREVRDLQVGFALGAAERYARMAADFEWVEESTFSGPPPSADDPRVRLVSKVPAGVVSAITPFNFPLMMNVQKVFPSLAVGCTTVLKPTPDACLDAALLIEAAEAAELPRGVLNVLLGSGRDVGEVMASHPLVDVVTFTGSTETGRRIMELAAPTVKRVVLELGGKSPNIVFDDADLDELFATDPALLRHAGQGCGQLTRIIVQRGVYDEVVDRLADRMRGIRVGDPSDPQVELGPVANRAQFDKITGLIERAIDDGAKLVHGGGRPAGVERGYFIEPTLFADVDNSWEIARDEIFGPVLVVIPFEDEAEGIRIADDSPYGINGAVWTRDQERGWRVARGVRAGNFGINCLANVMDGPHGGFKQTGIGREWWGYSLNEYVEMRGFSAVS